MGLALRKEKILSAVVEKYIESGEPIGSKALQTLTDLGVSSATIRNALKALDECRIVVTMIPTIIAMTSEKTPQD